MGTLAGRRIVVTRRPEQVSTLVRLLEERGATVLELPAIEIVPPADLGPLDAALGSLERYDWVVFTSANAVAATIRRTMVLGLPPLIGSRGTRIASIGPSTTVAIQSAFPADTVALEPTVDHRAAGLVQAFAGRGCRGARVLVPASSRAREELAAGLRELGAQVEVVSAYATVEPEGLRERVAACLAEGFDAVAFASPSAVEAFAVAAGEASSGLPAAVIGKTTAAAARAAGLAVGAVASVSTTEGLVEALERWLGSARCP